MTSVTRREFLDHYRLRPGQSAVVACDDPTLDSLGVIVVGPGFEAIGLVTGVDTKNSTQTVYIPKASESFADLSDHIRRQHGLRS